MSTILFGRLARSMKTLAVASLFAAACSTGALKVGSDNATVRNGETPPAAALTDDAAALDAAPFDAPPALPLDSGSFVDAHQSLYDRLGGHVGTLRVMNELLAALLQDPQQASYFVLNVPTPAPHHPSGSDIVECLTAFVGSAIGGPEVYPTTTSSGYACRPLVEAHQGILADGGSAAEATNYRIPNGVFNDLLATLATTATKDGVAPDDVTKLGVLFGVTRSWIVDPTRADGGYFDGG